MTDIVPPKIHISYEFTDDPWGGGNQFLKALRRYFRQAEVYTELPEEAEMILFNSHHCLDKVLKLKRKHPNKVLIHRVDGPISLVRGRDKIVDETIYAFNKLLADGTIFISDLSKRDNYKLGMKKAGYESVILSTPDPAIFSPEGKKPFSKDKIKLIATSWSGNIRKGFDIYKFLDEHLDFNKYEMTFVGNSPIEFKNIKRIRPVPSQELAGILKENDIYITATKYEPFGQAVVEALKCGLPAVVTSAGGYMEVAGKAVEVFTGESDIINAIEKVARNYEYYQQQISLPTLEEVGRKYYEFAQKIYVDYSSGNYIPKQISLVDLALLRGKLFLWQTLSRGQATLGALRHADKKTSATGTQETASQDEN